jgi:GPH family glycoside/pentoside/hexuronide:cation symporter
MSVTDVTEVPAARPDDAASASKKPKGPSPHTQKLGWAFGDYGFNIFWQALNLLMMPFYTDVLGLEAGLAGMVFLVASLWDGFADSVIGAFADRTRSKYGSYRPYLIFASPVMVIAFMVAFMTPDWDQGGLFLYALLSQVFLRTAYSVVSIPYSSLSSRISSDSNERAFMAGARVAFAMLGGMTVTFLMPAVVDCLQARTGEASPWAYVLAAGMAGLISLPVFWVTFLTTREPPQLAERAPKGFSLSAVWEDFRSVGGILAHNGPLLRVFGCMIVSSLAFTMTNKCITYYVTYYLERPDLRQYILPTVLFVQFLFCPIWAWVAQRTSKRQAWLYANCVSVLAYLAFFLNDSRDPLVNAALLAGLACGNAAYLTLVWAMLPDTVEYTQWKTGERHDAKVFGVASFSKQLALGVNGWLLGTLLAAVGYVEKAKVQPPEAIEGLKLIMTFVPVTGLLLSAIIVWGYRLDQAEHARISREMAERT